ncbi:ABC transporter permease [Catellatospora sp. NPDC049609]|uniref:ABC transporter permease n=1 Tax=Catellatospora sp. NPDC049609 TaxID=3155505 RepID=UPI003426C604
MTAPTSAYPVAVADLVDDFQKWAAELGTTPSQNATKARFKVGSDKARALLATLTAPAPAPAERITTPAPAAPVVEPVPVAEPAASAPTPEPVPDVPAEPIKAPASPQTAVDADLGAKIAPAIAETAAAAPVTVARPKRRIRSWPVFIIGLGAFVGIWSGWVELGKLTGFGPVQPLPGIADDFSLNTAITLPLGMEAYAAYALKVWMTSGIPARARDFARWSTIVALLVGMAGQVAYHLMAANGITSAPWQITTAVACLPVIVLGLAATLAHLVANGDETPPNGADLATTMGARLVTPARRGGQGDRLASR